MKNPITIETKVQADIDKVWKYWTEPKHIEKWNNASDDWHTVSVENDVKEEGEFKYRMEAKDGTMGFDFGGTYSAVKKNDLLEYALHDGRKVKIEFLKDADRVKIVETFEPESENSVEMQKQGWQAILANFKKYVED
ncbi:Uncharacterized conserved protein YndB, AHSA1/START domain [Flavobacteriaceae bacterium MAR_2010_188]|nr:Uncharacterized conserved protein YndB, AHSA1/START domain [Flavobacteriaceae bacterium MAR_2010_188]